MIKNWEVKTRNFVFGLNLNTRHLGFGLVLHTGEPRYKDYGYIAFGFGPLEFWISGKH